MQSRISHSPIQFGVAAAVALVMLQPLSTSSEELSLAAFDKVEAGGGAELTITVGAARHVTVVGEDRDKFDIQVDGTALEIKPRGWDLLDHDGGDVDLQVTMRMPSLSALKISSGASAQVTGVESDRLAVTVSSGGHMEMSGRCNRLEIKASTGAFADTGDLQCERVDAEVSTGANLHVFALEDLDASASLGGNITISGKPDNRRIRESLGGNVGLQD